MGNDHRKTKRGGGTFTTRDNPELVAEVRKLREERKRKRDKIGLDDEVTVEPNVPLQFRLVAAAKRGWGPLED